MSNTIAQSAHIHIPWTTIIVILVSALAAAAVLVLVNQPADVTVETQPVVLTAPGAVAMPQLETHAQIMALTGRGPAAAGETRAPDTRHNFPIGALNASGSVAPATGDVAPARAPDTRHNFPAGTSLD